MIPNYHDNPNQPLGLPWFWLGLAGENRGETNPFNKRRCNQHRCLNLSVGFRLTGNRFHGTSTDHTDADTGSDYGESCTYYTWNFHKIIIKELNNSTTTAPLEMRQFRFITMIVVVLLGRKAKIQRRQHGEDISLQQGHQHLDQRDGKAQAK